MRHIYAGHKDTREVKKSGITETYLVKACPLIKVCSCVVGTHDQMPLYYTAML